MQLIEEEKKINREKIGTKTKLIVNFKRSTL